MRQFFVRHKFLMKLCVAALAVSLFCGVFLVMGWGPLLHRVGGTVIYPFQWAFSKIGDGVTGFVQHFEDVDKLQDKIEALERENESLRAEINDAEIMKEEQSWLYGYLSMKQEHEDYAMCAASVIAESGQSGSGNFATVLTLNKGSAHGIEVGMPVVSTLGLVGMVTETGPNQCYVQTLLNTSSSVGALSVTTLDKGLLEGDFACLYEGCATLRYLPENAALTPGDKVITSGQGTVYPYGIPVGTVTEVTVNPYSRTREAKIQPFHDFSDTDEVIILTSYLRYTEGDHIPEEGESS
ncbi:MAG: rod shape-determining protein MreC [Ruminococcaceae bacterium]|nr:rod shape-determining protein MreC [Oscillospiraceae bacterium]